MALDLHPGADTLFESNDALPPEAAYWLQQQAVSQFNGEGPNAQYSAQLLKPLQTQIPRLASDAMVYHAGIVLILFTADQPLALRDLQTWQSQCLDRGHRVGSPALRQTNLTDRVGHSAMTVALFPIGRA